MKKIKLNEDVSLSNLVLGVWRLNEWNYNTHQLLHFINECMALGITSFDHADIYGNYECEEIFGNAIKSDPSLKDKIEITTKCGIKLISDKCPTRSVKHYDTSKTHIIQSAENSLKKINVDKIDLLLLHRPDPMINPYEVAEAFAHLKDQGKVMSFGVSNFLPAQFKALQAYLDFPLVTNQIELSVLNHENFHNHTIDYCQESRIKPMIWSPLGGGKIFNPQNIQEKNLAETLQSIQLKYELEQPEQIAYAWLLSHPLKMIPILGTGKIDRIKTAVDTLPVKLSREDWFRIWTAGEGEEVP
ncbi:MAG TPA: aldo/keto reductase family oxidoreductase [Cyclobacteriaceae bacterium]